ncbi:Pvc16 family protein [Pyxidicoccus sp. MSG2]|uniref:Pvc16 family protein n=1 Tax=Pyxidicoccus sp. MSG2 TaxID=2996790 RepID=UPI00226DEC41|nr:Pvc16 family protein [Pyxidicoccus sp. MSG2]MCY1022095.1 Pvc16 family protein [Pyxidicoccus sp. MSG2]
MATYAAISAVGQGVLALLEQSCPKPEFEGAKFRLYQASDFKAPMDEGVSLFLYRVMPSTVRRNLPGRVDSQGRRTRRPLPLDLYYLLTPWAKTAVKQHRLLGWAMRQLEDTPTLTASFLNHYGTPETDTFLPEETVTLVYDPLSIQDMLNIWKPGEPNIQVSATYIARMVGIESAIADEEAGPVQTRVLAPGRLTER